MKKTRKKKENKKAIIIKEKKNIPESIREIYNSPEGQKIPANKDDGVHRVIQVPEKVAKKITDRKTGKE